MNNEGWPVGSTEGENSIQYSSPQEAADAGWPVEIPASSGTEMVQSEAVIAPIASTGLAAETVVEAAEETPSLAAANPGWPSNHGGEIEIEDDVRPPSVEVVAGDAEDPVAKAARIKAELGSWLEAKETATAAVDDERNWRDRLTKSCFPTPKKGTQRFALDGGYNIKLQQTFTYKLLSDETNIGEDEQPKPFNTQIEELEDRISELGPIAAERLKRLIRWKPELSGSEYEKLDPKDETDLAIRNLLDKHLEIKPGAPQLVLEEPKEAK